MSFHLHELTGCAPAPLAHYLKALGILRLVCEQADPEARGFWRGERFFLISRMSRDELQGYFSAEYEPTPMFAPWNAGCGFYKTWDDKQKKLRNSKNVDALEALRAQVRKRFSRFVSAAEQMAQLLSQHARHKDVMSLSKKERQNHLILSSNKHGNLLPMFDKDLDKQKLQELALVASSAFPFVRSVIAATADDAFKYPGLWGGTGGNAGNMEFSARFFENVLLALVVLSAEQSLGFLKNSLYGENISGLLTGGSGKAGQFLPSGAGGVNSVDGFGDQNDTLLNPWDFVLMIEGAVVLSSATTSRLRGNRRAVSSPFVVDSNQVGFASAATAEANKGEQWLPLWKNPLSRTELAHFLGEGRMQLQRRHATDTLDFARSVATLGAARGVDSFQRFGYVTRNGDLNFAIPLGRFVVPENAGTSIRNLDDLETWLTRLNRLARDKDASSRLKLAVKCLLEDALAVAQQPERAAHWQSILISASNLEAIQASGTGFSAGPIPKLRKEWIEAANDGSVEFRLAVAFAAQAARFPSNRAAQYPIRDHFQTLSNARFATSGSLTSQRLLPAPQVVVLQRNAIDDCIAIVGRRLIDRAKLDTPGFPLRARTGFTTTAADLATLIAGSADLERTLRLARALCALNFRDARMPLSSESSSMLPDDAWLVIRLSLLPWPLVEDRQIPVDPAIVRRLSSGDAAGAFDLARQRLCAFGIHPTIRQTSQPPAIAKWWAAALAFPLSQGTARRFLKRIDPNFSVSKQP